MTELASVSDYAGLVDALRDRKESLGLTDRAIEEIAGFHGGYAGKLLGEMHVRTFGQMSLGAILGALGLRIVLVEDATALERAKRHGGWETKLVESDQTSREVMIGNRTIQRAFDAVLKEFSRRGNEARRTKLSARRRRAIARHAGKCSWAKRRQAKRAKSRQEITP